MHIGTGLFSSGPSGADNRAMHQRATRGPTHALLLTEDVRVHQTASMPLAVPEGQPKIAQRFIAGTKVQKENRVPEGRLNLTNKVRTNNVRSLARIAPTHRLYRQ